VSVASEYDRAEQVVADVVLLHDMAAGRLDEQRVREAARVGATSCPVCRSRWRPAC
jgi:hypothetical protein